MARDLNVYLDVEAALSEDERREFLDAVARLDPRLRGAKVADVLSIADDADSFLGIVEPMFEEHADELTAMEANALFRPAVCARIVLAGREDPGWESVRELIERALARRAGRRGLGV